MTTYLTSTTLLLFAAWLMIGLVIYELYDYRHSHLNITSSRKPSS